MQAVKPFLYNLFYDPAIINLPKPLRFLVAKLISYRRTPKASDIYKQMGGQSTILQETYKQALSLEKTLGGGYKVFTYMRYTYPRINDVLDNIKLYSPDKIVLLPLYPQYSTTTTKSSIREWETEAKRRYITIDTHSVLSYETNDKFINAYAQLLTDTYRHASKFGKPIILFSAHGIPLNRVENGDPYEKHVTASVDRIIEETAISEVEYEVCYQSKVGPLKWLAPATNVLIEKYSKDNRVIIVLPVSFVSEHSETLVELDIQYRDLAKKHGAKAYFRVPTIGTHPLYIECLKDLINKSLKADAA